MIGTLPIFREDGLLRSTFVYVLLCPRGHEVFAKVGHSVRPTERMGELRVGCPVAPKTAMVIECWSAPTAKRLERKLHESFRDHKSGGGGEWFVFDMRDSGHKSLFNGALRLGALKFVGEGSFWSKINVAALGAYQRVGRAIRRARAARFRKSQHALSRLNRINKMAA